MVARSNLANRFVRKPLVAIKANDSDDCDDLSGGLWPKAGAKCRSTFFYERLALVLTKETEKERERGKASEKVKRRTCAKIALRLPPDIAQHFRRLCLAGRVYLILADRFLAPNKSNSAP